MIAETEIEVRYAETDRMGVVYHANYLVWFEIARTRFLDELGFPYVHFEEEGIMSPVLHAECDYHRSLTFGDTAVVRTRLVELSGVRNAFYYEVFRKGTDGGADELCCTGKTSHCLVRSGSFRPLSLKKTAPELYAAYARIVEPLG